MKITETGQTLVALQMLFFLSVLTPLLHAVLDCSTVIASPVILFTEKEGEKLSMSEQEWQLILQAEEQAGMAADDVQPYSEADRVGTVTERDGPIVSIINPTSSGIHYEADIPVNLLVFLKSYLAPIDIDTLHIKGKRGIFSLNITDRLKPFLRQPTGGENADYVIEGSIPSLRPGRYHVVMSLADVRGNVREQSLFLRIISE
ncbi:MAG: hypothetical protein V2I36_10645 [Desulfopila sp.]|jgi:hypothetical protein|nr:hypothetical protein [Desulfopila sp.]